MALSTHVIDPAATLVTLGGVTQLLPRHAHVERSAFIAAPPEHIVALAASTVGYRRFNPYLSMDPALRIDPFGSAEGVGAGFRFQGRDGRGSQIVAELGPDGVRYDIDPGRLGRPVQATRVEGVQGRGTQVTWTMDMDLGRNPVSRVFGLFMDRMIGKTFNKGLENLALVVVGRA